MIIQGLGDNLIYLCQYRQGSAFVVDPGTMWQLLQKLTALPDDTLIYAGHDYTVENYEFALQFEPELRAALKMLDAEAVQVFAELRRRKDVF
jgi:glyoxylase-like metal-dependent hydrolase (beta-lactamase superfamily II)